jgi:serine/threonine-protein kinase
VYAAGVLLWELLVGTPPHSGDTAISVAHKHVYEDVPPPSTAVGGIPPELDALVVRATRRDPGSRPADAGEFLRELQRVRETLPAPAPLSPETRTLVVPRVVDKTPARPARPRKSHRGLIAAVVLLVLALLAAFGGYYLGSYRYTHAPNLTGLSVAQAQDRVEKAGLDYKQVERFDEAKAGTELGQDPPAGKRIKKSSTVTVIFSKGPDVLAVPDVRNKDAAAASSLLSATGLKVSSQVLEYSSSISDGKVIRTEPPAGQRLRRRSSVKLFVSKGAQPVAVPDLQGKTQAEATKTLRDDLGFNVAVTTAYSDSVPKGIVITNSPNSGTAPKGSTVTLTVSQGPEFVKVPELRYDTTSDATRQLKALGLAVAVKTRVQGGNGQLVLDTDPKAGKKVHVGTTVTLLVY